MIDLEVTSGARGERLQVVPQLAAAELVAMPWESMYEADNENYVYWATPDQIRQDGIRHPRHIRVAELRPFLRANEFHLGCR